MLAKKLSLNGVSLKISALVFLFPALLAGFFIFTNIAHAEDIIISEDTVWTSGVPVVIDGAEGLVVSSGTTLTLEAGVIIKLAENNNITIQGNLNINGTANNPVIITSVKDDQAGGDTNNDGNSTSPAPMDWGAILIANPNSNINIDYANIKYAGGYSIGFNLYLGVIEANTINIDHSNIINNYGLARIDTVNNIAITNSNIYNLDFCEDLGGTEFCGSTILNTGETQINAVNNYWGHAEGPTVDPEAIKGTFLSGDIIYEPFSAEEIVFKDSKIRVAVILAETKDVKHASSSITAQPCKLIPEKTYPNGHDKEYYEDLLSCVKDYHCENSFGKRNEQGECAGGLVDLEFEFYDNGNWQDIGKDTSEYRTESDGPRKEYKFMEDVAARVSMADDYDIILFVGPGDSSYFGGYFDTLARGGGSILLAENDGIYFAAHEVAHLLGLFFTPKNSRTLVPDLYEMGEAQGWDIMHNADTGTINNPMSLSSYVLEFLGWLNYDIHSRGQFGDYLIEYLKNKEYGDDIFRYNLEDNDSEDVQEYYIIEARNKNINKWDSSISVGDTVVLYYVDENGTDEYGYSDESVSLNELRTVSIPGLNGAKFDLFNDGVLKTSETFRDFDKLVKIIADGKEENTAIKVKIEDMTEKDWRDKFWGFILKDKTKIIRNSSYAGFAGAGYVTDAELDRSAKEQAVSMIPFILVILFLLLASMFFYKFFTAKFNKIKKNTLSMKIAKVIALIPILVLFLYFIILLLITLGMLASHKNIKYLEYIDVFAPPVEDMILPDTDLHLYCDDGRHVGINYETGEYEIGIPEAETIGDGYISREWIFVPEEYKSVCHFVVSSIDTENFIEENPQAAAEIGYDNLKNDYEVYARYIDPEEEIKTSDKVIQSLNPGELVEYIVDMDNNGLTIPQNIPFDIVAPTTTIEIIGTQNNEGGYLSTVRIELSAQDDNSGLLKTEYSLDNGETWTSYEEPIIITEDGEHRVIYSSTDRAGNREIEKEAIISIHILSDIDLAILNIDRLYSEGKVNNQAKDALISRLSAIEEYQESYGERQLERSAKQEEIMQECIAENGEEFCEEKLGQIFDRIDYALDQIHETILKARYSLLLSELKLYRFIRWVSSPAYDIIKTDIENLRSKI